ncbi:neutral/alkaline non-lysosomal ceramidase N-terminal domain-containing protein [Thalassoroseus pseudoceratinae]|uniref:neutral/alkaline non-lysosomal ceramidase N-terminal domain-containing protein n=1 Tax=Thalassoroseus pseudoceratinae TaxID=2713176 RepID=UPI001420258C|nr:neutral/alkaline non-lysosomal ceramidase N-terminal domain-containing protein [Thalassoroseus pseudoceratinae]
MSRRSCLNALLLVMLMTIPTFADEAKNQWKAGFGKVVITPDEPQWLNGYGGRTEPSDGKIHDLFARAAAFRDANDTTIVMVALDVVSISTAITDRISAAVEKSHNVPRANIMFACSHTHCGPALDDRLSHMLKMDEAAWAQVRKYQKIFDAKVTKAIQLAIDNLEPAILKHGTGQCGFASNRRAPLGEGPVDHTVPVLAAYSVKSDSKTPMGIIFGYACHNTTLGIQQWCGDYAGFAAIDLEEHHPGSVALFFTGCGADSNPLPRRKIELAQMYGRMLSLGVEAVLPSLTELKSPVQTNWTTIDLPFESVPTEEELKATAETGSFYLQQRAKYLLNEAKELGKVREDYSYPIQVWRFGDELTWVALGGEVVVDYVIRLKATLPGKAVWVTGYANDVMAYIPSERVLTEGGYEGDRSMVYYQQPSKWRAGLEDRIVETTAELAGK